MLAAGVCSATFDSFAFPASTTFSLVIGLIAAAWRLVHDDSTTALPVAAMPPKPLVAVGGEEARAP